MTAPAALLALKSFNLLSGWPKLAALSTEEFDDYLADMGILWKFNPCPHCGEGRKISKEKNANGETKCQKFACFKRECRASGRPVKTGFLCGTFFERLHTDRKKLFLCSFLFVTSSMTVSEIAKNVEVDEKTVVQWEQWYRDIMVEHFSDQVGMIGGPGEVVQIDETNIVKRKHNVGRVVRDGWLVGGIQDGSRCVFVEITGKRDQVSLETIIKKYVAPGTTVITDCWKGYNGLTALGYDHQTVNHSKNFVDPITKVHTQRVESLWCQIKRRIKPKCGLKGDQWDDHYYEALWHFKYHDESKFYELWRLITQKYRLT